MYQVAKNMQMVAQQAEKERKKYKSLWEDEDNESPEKADPIETADNAEYSGELPDIEITSAAMTYYSFRPSGWRVFRLLRIYR